MTDTNQLDASLAAARRKGHPFVTWPGDVERFKANPALLYDLPTLGNYIPLGWKRTDVMVLHDDIPEDKGIFFDLLREEKGYAIMGRDTNAVVVGIYTKEVEQ